MTDRPILFSGPMVRALLDGRKTQTRRVLRPVRGVTLKDFEFGKNEPNEVGNWGRLSRDKIRNPDFSIGDRLWVREAWRVSNRWDKTKPRDLPPRTMTTFYESGGSMGGIAPMPNDRERTAAEYVPDSDYPGGPMPTWVGKRRSSMFIPRWGSRLTLLIADVRVQRVQDISEADAKAEGAPWYVGGHGVISDEEYSADPGYQPSKKAGFEWLWGEIHGLGAWSSNPWVVALIFNVENRNIDST